MDVVIESISYPENEAAWYAKGSADVLEEDTYFEVPAIFNADGSCDIPATQAKVETVLNYLCQRKRAQAASA